MLFARLCSSAASCLLNVALSCRQPAVEMHIVRVAYLSRVLRLGLNVLLIDADILLFKDPYRWG